MPLANGALGAVMSDVDNTDRLAWQTGWFATLQEVTSDADSSSLQIVLRHAFTASEADISLLGHFVTDEHIEIDAVVGSLAELKPGLQLTCPTDPRVGSMIVAPFIADGHLASVLIVGRRLGATPFTPADSDQFCAFANFASLVLGILKAQADSEIARLSEDHERIAADLHDHVVQGLFAAGVGIESLSASMTSATERDRLVGYIATINSTIRRIRTTILGLSGSAEPVDDLAVRDDMGVRLRTVVDDLVPALGLRPTVEIVSDLALSASDPLSEEIVAVLREALSNVARHAHADHVIVRVVVVGARVTVEVTDDGCGLGTVTRSSGIANMRRRAENLGGSLDLTSPESGGTHLQWTAYAGD